MYTCYKTKGILIRSLTCQCCCCNLINYLSSCQYCCSLFLVGWFYQERSLELELTQGDAAALMQSANELLEWVETNLNQDFLHERPPGELDQLLNNSEGIKVQLS